MDGQKIKVLLAEDNPSGSPFWQRILSEIKDSNIQILHIKKLSDVGKSIEENLPDVIILDLTLPEGKELKVFLDVYKMAPAVPIIVILGKRDQKLAVDAMQEGAQDCLVKSDIDSYLLGRSMRYAIGRQKHLKELRAFSVIDELTGLYNRRGFLTLVEQQFKMVDRTGQSLLLVFVDLDGLKSINDSLGHHRGDLALMETAHVLRESFRETDIVARLGGDEFAALLTSDKDIGSEASLKRIQETLDEHSAYKRFQEMLDEHNAYRGRDFKLSVSIGIALYNPLSPCSIGELLEKADQHMYEMKKTKNKK
jgi:two-component system, cell cycle response regulator